MSSLEDLIHKYQSYPDHRLIEMLRYRKDYVPEAVKAAQMVLDQRSIEQKDIDLVVKELENREKEKLAAASQPLSRGEKLIFSLVPLVGLVFLLMALTDAQGKGQEKRMSQILVYAGIGLMVFIVLLLLGS